MSAVADKLAEARKLIEAGWTQSAYARGKSGRPVYELSRYATCHCAAGAIMWVTKVNLPGFAEETRYLVRAIGGENVSDVFDWNDAPERTKAEVLAAFDRAIELARVDA